MVSKIISTLLALAVGIGPIAVKAQCSDPNAFLLPVNSNFDPATVMTDPRMVAVQYTLGPRFVNALAQDNTNQYYDNVGDLQCVVNCAATLVKSAPCIAVAVAEKNPFALLSCASKDDVCDCLECLPSQIYDFVEPWCKSNSTQSGNSTVTPYNYAGFTTGTNLARSSLQFSAFRGDIRQDTYNNLQTYNVCQGTFVNGTCGCCVGLYVDVSNDQKYNCMGQCFSQ